MTNATQAQIEERLADVEPDVEVLLLEQANASTLRLVVDHPAGVDLDMCARCNLRHDAAIRLVRMVLPNDRLRQDTPVGRHQRHRAIVARRFKAQNQSHFATDPLPDRQQTR